MDTNTHIVTRQSTFETNSSSTHSIIIEAGDYIPSHLPVVDGTCQVHAGEFGWEVEAFHDAATKASYALTYVKSLLGHMENKSHRRDQSDWLLQRLRDVIREATGAEVVVFVPIHAKGEKPYGFVQEKPLEHDHWGYIDHQSDGVCYEAFETDDTLRAFIFNEASTLQTDNDNH